MTKHSGVSGLARQMLVDMEIRFGFVQKFDSPRFDPLFITSTFLSLPYRDLLDQSQVSLARDYLLKLIREIENVTDNDSYTALEEGGRYELQDCEDTEPPVKRFKHLSRVSNLLESQRKDETSQTTSQGDLTAEELEIQNYTKYRPSKEDFKLDPLEYWVDTDRRKQYPKLALIACDLLATPTSTAPVERIFSSAGETSKGKRNRLSEKNVERETFLRRNKAYISCYLHCS
jgi:hypothetical protein